MITLEDLRQSATALPEAEEATHFGQASFKVRGKPFAGIERDGRTAVFSVSQEDAAALVAAHGATYEEVWRTAGRRIFVGLRVDLETLTRDRMQQLVQQGWRHKAPKRLVVAYDQG